MGQTVSFELGIFQPAVLYSCTVDDLGYTEEEWENADDSEKEDAILQYMEDEDKPEWEVSNIKTSW